MPTINVTNNVGLTAGLSLRDDSPLSKAKPTQFVSTAKALYTEWDHPVNQTSIRTAEFGFTLTAPSISAGVTSVVPISGGVKGSITVLKPADQDVFASDPFSPSIPIDADSCWVAIETDGTLDVNAYATVDGFGLGVDATATLAMTTYYEVKKNGTFCTLREAVEQALNHFSAACTVETLHTQPEGTIYVSDLSGALKISATYSLPVNMSALASARLPLNFDIQVQPNPEVTISAAIKIGGEFAIRAYRMPGGKLTLGAYKKKSTEFDASIEAGMGLEVAHGTTDLLSGLFGAIAGPVDLTKAGMDEDTLRDLNKAVTISFNRSVSACVNVECSATVTDEAAVIYAIDLTTGDAAKTDAALRSALKGDWTSLASLGNAKELRNILKKTQERSHATAVNLLGIYNASSLAEFVKSCNILHDENGEVIVTDNVTAKWLASATVPFGADHDKLRQAKVEAFAATAAYTATAASMHPDVNLSLKQNYYHYEARMDQCGLRKQILLGDALNLLVDDNWIKAGASQQKFAHVKAAAVVTHDQDAVLRVFFSDQQGLVARKKEDFVAVGRKAMAKLIPECEDGGKARRTALASDVIWQAMAANGNMGAFSTLPVFRSFQRAEIGAISTDWADITWWAEAMESTGEKLKEVLAVVRNTPGDISKNNAFMSAREKLADALKKAANRSKAAFADGWGLAVLFALGNGIADAQMDLSSDGRQEHFANRQRAIGA